MPPSGPQSERTARLIKSTNPNEADDSRYEVKVPGHNMASSTTKPLFLPEQRSSTGCITLFECAEEASGSAEGRAVAARGIQISPGFGMHRKPEWCPHVVRME